MSIIAIEGIKVIDKERLLLLKLWGYFRADERKIRKDMLDVLSLILYGNTDLEREQKNSKAE